MVPHVVKYASVFLLSMVKFFGGPIAGVAAGVPFAATVGLTVAGMMCSVVLISSLGKAWALHQRRKRRKEGKPLFSKRSRRIVQIYSRFGMGGIAFLTPILFSPIGGTVIATQLHVPRFKIMLHMLWSALFWSFLFTTLAVRFSHLSIFHH